MGSIPPVKVAIIGGGPGGLGAAIEFGKLNYIDWTLYEKKPEISETGGGISLQRHTWRLLELTGAAKNVDPNDFFRAEDGTSGQTSIEGIPRSPVFWQNVGGKYVFTCPLGGDDFEVTARIRRPTEGQEHVSWGRSFDFSTIASEYDEFCEPVRKVIQLAAQGKTEEFALFSGARLESVISHDAIALIGDASHPLSGAFGAGAGFALEDVWALTRSLDFARTNGEGLAAALKLYDQIRSPHYRDLYGVLDSFAAVNSKLLAEHLPADDEIEERVRRASEKKATWMYHYEVDKAVEKFFGGQGQSVQPAALL
ncbi:hypothetical protein COL26b_011249 [Colletotrichum chrysophilum]|uniref:uncharacterized protein n=1 Tax=Colletotrichum chrysophilum TaxID=1836956 RepID=UPI002301033B|nr:uncharacterized protein COL26b_011249 [Colletotrichum chrysophilum]KAJ0367409.1 hypothetical protein COL26b_011249 [Colletotrichum chrysophilum]